MKCKQCGNESKTKYCSGKCRSAAYRARTSARPKTEAHAHETSAHAKNERTESPELSAAHTANNNLPLNFGLDNCQCKHCQQCRTNNLNVTLWHGKQAVVIGSGLIPLNRVSLPGDIDYIGVCSIAS
jgi:hypothetical protein